MMIIVESKSPIVNVVSTVSDMLSDYGTTSAVARKQIEKSLIKSGHTGFKTGQLSAPPGIFQQKRHLKCKEINWSFARDQ